MDLPSFQRPRMGALRLPPSYPGWMFGLGLLDAKKYRSACKETDEVCGSLPAQRE